jgi:tRNA1Val (adenine37-N6)-methyltransferase
MSDFTIDTFLNGRIRIHQETKGYRFSVDAIIVASGVHPKPGEKILDLGTGCGIISILLAFRYPAISITGVEIQHALAELARRNVVENQMQNRVSIISGDIRTLSQSQVGGPVDWIISNPPYHKPDSGRINPTRQKALARHEIHLNLQELLEAVKKLLRNGGWFITIYPSVRIVALFGSMKSVGIEPKRMQSIHSTANDKAKFIRVQGKMGGRPGLEILPPLIIYNPDGTYTEEMQKMMSP